MGNVKNRLDCSTRAFGLTNLGLFQVKPKFAPGAGLLWLCPYRIANRIFTQINGVCRPC